MAKMRHSVQCSPKANIEVHFPTLHFLDQMQCSNGAENFPHAGMVELHGHLHSGLASETFMNENIFVTLQIMVWKHSRFPPPKKHFKKWASLVPKNISKQFTRASPKTCGKSMHRQKTSTTTPLGTPL
eukprot:EG_transcript_36425